MLQYLSFYIDYWVVNKISLPQFALDCFLFPPPDLFASCQFFPRFELVALLDGLVSLLLGFVNMHWDELHMAKLVLLVFCWLSSLCKEKKNSSNHIIHFGVWLSSRSPTLSLTALMLMVPCYCSLSFVRFKKRL